MVNDRSIAALALLAWLAACAARVPAQEQPWVCLDRHPPGALASSCRPAHLKPLDDDGFGLALRSGDCVPERFSHRLVAIERPTCFTFGTDGDPPRRICMAHREDCDILRGRLMAEPALAIQFQRSVIRGTPRAPACIDPSPRDPPPTIVTTECRG